MLTKRFDADVRLPLRTWSNGRLHLLSFATRNSRYSISAIVHWQPIPSTNRCQCEVNHYCWNYAKYHRYLIAWHPMDSIFSPSKQYLWILPMIFEWNSEAASIVRYFQQMEKNKLKNHCDLFHKISTYGRLDICWLIGTQMLVSFTGRTHTQHRWWRNIYRDVMTRGCLLRHRRNVILCKIITEKLNWFFIYIRNHFFLTFPNDPDSPVAHFRSVHAIWCSSVITMFGTTRDLPFNSSHSVGIVTIKTIPAAIIIFFDLFSLHKSQIWTSLHSITAHVMRFISHTILTEDKRWREDNCVRFMNSLFVAPRICCKRNRTNKLLNKN